MRETRSDVIRSTTKQVPPREQVKPPIVKNSKSITDRQKLSKINSILISHIGNRESLEVAIKEVLKS